MKNQYKEDFIKIRFQSVKKTLRRQAHTYSYGIDTHSIRKKTSYARYLYLHTESYQQIQSDIQRIKVTFIQPIWLRNALTKQSARARSPNTVNSL